MNVNECANCILHGWKQPVNKDDLQKCKRCKLIQYCGKACQTEHWQNLHKRQCKYFADPALAQESKHNVGTCTICLQAASVGKEQLRNQTNPNYFYTSPEWKLLQMSDLHHAHPFPVTGQPGNTREKLLIVLLHLTSKFKQSQPKVISKISNLPDELKRMTSDMLFQRVGIWQKKKIYPQPEYFGCEDIAMFLDPQFLRTFNKAMKHMSVEDPLQLWKTIVLVDKMALDEYMVGMLSVLKDPLTSLPIELRKLVTRGLENKTKFLAVVNQVLDALVSRAVPYQDILKIICGGSLKQKCNSCSKKILITGLPCIDHDVPVVFFDCLFTEVFLCSDKNCRAKMGKPMIEELEMFGRSMGPSVTERMAHRCDFCSLVSPAGDIHRCSRCHTKIYCSKSCQLEDWKIHQMVCEEDAVERKKKLGIEGRREKSRKARELFKGDFAEDVKVKEACEMLEKFGLKKAKK